MTGPARQLNVYFDVDDTIITWDVRLRPGVREVFEMLRADGHTVHIWSGVGVRWEVVRRFSLEPFIAGCFQKPLSDHQQRLPALGVTAFPDFVVDDHIEVVQAFFGTQVAPPAVPLETDREMWRVYDEIRAFAALPPQLPAEPGQPA